MKKTAKFYKKQISKGNWTNPLVTFAFLNDDTRNKYNKYVDKYSVKYEKDINKIFEKYNIKYPKTLFTFDKDGEINGDIPQNKTIFLKSNMGSLNVIKFNSNDITKKTLSKVYKKLSKTNNYWERYGEYQYKGRENVCFAEESIGNVRQEYKIHILNKWKFVTIDSLIEKQKRTAYDWDMKHEIPYPSNKDKKKKPDPIKLNEFDDNLLSAIETMKKCSLEISELFGIYCRYDFYYENENIYFGEFTFTHSAGIDVHFQGDEELVKKYNFEISKANKVTKKEILNFIDKQK